MEEADHSNDSNELAHSPTTSPETVLLNPPPGFERSKRQRQPDRNSRILGDVFIEADHRRQSRVLEPRVLAARRRSLHRSRFLDSTEIDDLPALKSSQYELGYRPLDIAQYEARFVEIIPLTQHDDESDLVRCRLVQHSIVKALDYVALSYNWGNTTSEAAIVLNDVLIPVAANLEAALRELRRREERVIWCDFLSINQADDAERNFQVLRFGQIYSRARKVISWLGPEADGSDSAMVLLQEFDRLRRKQDSSRSTSRRGSAQSSRNSTFLREQVIPDRESSVFEAMDALLQRPYFQRAWILQEVSMASDVELLCGTESASLNAAEDYLKALKTINVSQQVPEFLRVLLHFRQREQACHIGEPRMVLLEALVTSKLSLTSDPRDKLYSLLALTRDSPDLIPTPNYLERPETAFLKATSNMIGIQGQSAVMLLAPRCTDQGWALPSWAPNWTGMREDVIPTWIIKAITKRRESRTVRPIANNYLLTIRAARLEQILSMSGQTQSLNGTQVNPKDTLSRSQQRDALITLWDTLTALCDDIPTSHNSDAAIIFALKIFLDDYAKQPRVAEMRALKFHNRRLQDWIEEYCDGEVAGMTRQATKSMPEYQCLKQAFRSMAEHKMKVAVAGDGENTTFRIVYRKAHVGDWVWRIHNCALPVVLRLVSQPSFERYQFVGEVFLEDIDGEGHWTRGTGWEAEHFAKDKWQTIEMV